MRSHTRKELWVKKKSFFICLARQRKNKNLRVTPCLADSPVNIWVRVREAEFASWSVLTALLWAGLGETARGLWGNDTSVHLNSPYLAAFGSGPSPHSTAPTLRSGMERGEGWGQEPEVTPRAR